MKSIRELRQQGIKLSVTRIARSRPDAIEKMVKVLIMWTQHQNQQKMHSSGMVIREKAKSLYGDRTKDTSDPVPFAASHG